jgi:hypothetical protein
MALMTDYNSSDLLLILALPALIGGVLILNRPRQAFMLFLFLSPLNYFYVIAYNWQVTWEAAGSVSEGAPAFIKYAKDAVFLAIVIAWMLLFLIGRKKHQTGHQVLDWLVSLFVAYQVIMTIPAGIELGSLPALIALWQNTGYALCYFILRTVVSNASIASIRLWISRLVLMGGLVACIGIVYYFATTSSFQYVSGSYQGLNRAVSTMGAPTNLGLYLGGLLIVSLAADFYKMGIFQFCAALVMAVCLLLTVSMSALFGTLIGVALILVKRRRWRQLFFAGALALLGTVLATNLVPSIGQRVLTVLSGEDEAWLLRLENWRQLWPSDPAAFLYGVGGGAGGAMTVSFHDQGMLADNQYLAVFIQFGSIGVALLIGILMTGIMGGLYFQSASLAREIKNLRLAASLMVMLVTLGSVSGNLLNLFPINLYFWAALALVASIRSKKTASAVGIPSFAATGKSPMRE